MDDVVVLDGVHKAFKRRYGAPTLRAHRSGTAVKKTDHALDDVSLTVAAGEAVGVLGTRRSGRSTLVSVIHGLYRPDQGSARVRGRATSFLSASAGFSLSVSTERNIALNAALLGIPQSRLDEVMSDVLAMSGLSETSLGHPLSDLSRAERRRLGYALVMYSDPDVLLADRKVAVGTQEFQEATLERVTQMRDEGVALVLATNHRPTLRRLCSRGIVMDSGSIVFDGPLKPAIQSLRQLRRKDN